MDEVSNTVDGTSTTKIVQIANSIATVISNKDFVDNSSVVRLFHLGFFCLFFFHINYTVTCGLSGTVHLSRTTSVV